MYSGLLPNGLSEADLSPDEDEETQNTQTEPGTEECPAESEQKLQNDPSSASASSPSSPSSPLNSCLPGVSQDMWKKFKDLQNERETQKTDQPPVRKRGKKRHRKGGTLKQADDAEQKRDGKEVRVKPWEELTQYFGTNDRFLPPASSRPLPKSGLEKSMERAIAEGDYGKAEELSDRLATRELAVKITQAADCRDFAQARREEEDSRAARKKRKQIAWGFEAKKRWETKSNMGFM